MSILLARSGQTKLSVIGFMDNSRATETEQQICTRSPIEGYRSSRLKLKYFLRKAAKGLEVMESDR